ncbi:MAG: tetratricopeptide repeat protein [Ignavibacteriaceae bacterium]|jgi:tetratricopeptide (TPR) repeat protein
MFKIIFSIKIKYFFAVISILVIIIPNISFASDADDLVKKGNEFYQDKQFSKAIDTYQQVIHLGYEGTSLYYNLANAYYRNGKLGLSILYYEKALKLSPGDDDVIHNLTFVNTKTVDKIDTLPKFFIFQWWEGFLALFSLTGWMHAVYIFYLLLLGSICLYFFAKRSSMQKYSFFSGLVSVLLLILVAIPLIINLNRELSVKSGVIIEPSATVKLAPDQTSSDAFIVHEGLKVRELDQVENWVKIRLQDGKEGWVSQNEIGAI